MARREWTRSVTPLRARRDRYDLARVGVTVICGLGGVVGATLAELDAPGVIGAGAAAAVGGIVVGSAIAKQFFSDVVEPVRTAVAAGADADRRLAVVLHRRAGSRPLGNADPYTIGVWRSAAADAHRRPTARRPPYIRRPAIDEALSTSLAAAGTRGGVVVAAGNPKAGKSRTLFEALAHSPATRRRTLYALRPPDETAGAVTARPFDTLLDAPMDIDGPSSVLWIDDAHEHFAYGLTLARLSELLERHEGLIVAMTVHTDQLQPPPRISTAGELTSVDRALLDRLSELAQGHVLPATLTAEEQMAARREYAGLSDSIEDPIDFERLPSWFAGVNYLRRRYRSGGPTNYGGVAVARAAINWRRAGMPAGINNNQLRQLAEIALDELDPGAAFTDGAYAVALKWAKGRDAASEPRWHGIALLRPVPRSKETLWRDFDAVTAWVTHGPDPDAPLSHASWEAILDHVAPETAIPVGAAAYSAGELEVSIRAHRLAADNPHAMYNLGVLLWERGDVEDLTEAEHSWRRAATDHDHPSAMNNLALLLQQRAAEGDVAQAEQWLRRAATDHDHPSAMTNLALLLQRRSAEGDVAEAEQWWRRAATDHDHPSAMTNLGVLLKQRAAVGEVAEAEQWWRRAATDHDHPDAMNDLALLLQRRSAVGDVAEAEQWWRRAATGHDHSDAMYNLGVLLRERGDVEDLTEAEHWWRRAATGHDHPSAMNNLALLLQQRAAEGDVAEAEQLWRQAATGHDHPDSMTNLAVLLRERGGTEDLAQAEKWLEQARRQESNVPQ